MTFTSAKSSTLYCSLLLISSLLVPRCSVTAGSWQEGASAVAIWTTLCVFRICSITRLTKQCNQGLHDSSRCSVDCIAVLMFSAKDVHVESRYEGFFASCCHQTLCRVSLPRPHKECPFGHSVIVPASSLTVRRGDRFTIFWTVSCTRFLRYVCSGFHDTSLQINMD